MTAILQVRDLSRSFGAVQVARGLSFEIAAGETVSIIGPNGSGKTTAINLIAGELRPDSGTVTFCGENITRQAPDAIARRGLRRTYQNGRVFGNATVAENVATGQAARARASAPLARLREVPVLRWLPLLAETAIAIVGTAAACREYATMHERAGAELARFGDRLAPRHDHPAWTLSYANRRRLEIARALAAQPRLLILDEPTAGMNPAETTELMHQLLALKAHGQAMIIVEHKLELVMTVSDRVIVMDGGEIVASGTPAQVHNDPRVVTAYLGRRRGHLPAQPGASNLKVNDDSA